MILPNTDNIFIKKIKIKIFYRSIPLMIQSVLPVAIFGDHSYTITMVGGTDVSFAPSMDYVQNVMKI